MNLTAITTTAQSYAKLAAVKGATAATKARLLLEGAAKTEGVVATAQNVAFGVGVWYGLDTLYFSVNKYRASEAKEQRLNAFREATSGRNFSKVEYELLSATVPTLRTPTKRETFKAFNKRQFNRFHRSVRMYLWSEYAWAAGTLLLPVPVLAWTQFLGTKVLNKVIVRHGSSLERKVAAMLREEKARNRRIRMNRWYFQKSWRTGFKHIHWLLTPVVREFYPGLPKIENGAIVYFSRVTGEAVRRVQVVPAVPTALERDEIEPFTTTEAINDPEQEIFTERTKITFDTVAERTGVNVDGEIGPRAKKLVAKLAEAEQAAFEVTEVTALDELHEAEANRMSAKRIEAETGEVVENWQMILEGADTYNRVGFDRVAKAYEQILPALPEGIEIDDPRRLGAALANQVRATKRSQLKQAREALPFWIIATLNDLDVTKLDDEDHLAAFIDYTDKSGLAILAGWDDVVGAKNLTSV